MKALVPTSIPSRTILLGHSPSIESIYGPPDLPPEAWAAESWGPLLRFSTTDFVHMTLGLWFKGSESEDLGSWSELRASKLRACCFLRVLAKVYALNGLVLRF